jgi:hypothetical protein
VGASSIKPEKIVELTYKPDMVLTDFSLNKAICKNFTNYSMVLFHYLRDSYLPLGNTPLKQVASFKNE